MAEEEKGSKTPRKKTRKKRAKSKAGTSSRPTLQRGDTGEWVKKAQVALGMTADGVFDNRMLGRVKRVQAFKGLDVDGIIGSKTWNAIL